MPKKKTRKIKKTTKKKLTNTQKKIKKESTTGGTITENQLGAIMERVDHRFELILEGQQAIKNELREEFKEEFAGVNSRIDKLEVEMRVGFSSVFEHLSKIEDELAEINKRIDKIEKGKAEEKELEKVKKRVKNAEERIRILEMFLKRKGLLEQANPV